MAGTTIDEGNIVYDVLRTTVQNAARKAISDDLLAQWTGTSKYEAIVGLLKVLGDERSRPHVVFDAFTDNLRAAYAATPPRPVLGSTEAFAVLREAGVRVVLQTGYARDLAQDLLDQVGWRIGEHIDALVSNDQVRSSRPAPYLIFHSMEQTDVMTPDAVLVAGDTANDLLAGTRSGARYVVGVLTGASTAEQLGLVRHTHIIQSVAGIPELLQQDGELPRRR